MASWPGLPCCDSNLSRLRREITGQRYPRRNANFLLIEELGKLVQIGIRDVRDGAIFHPLTAPVAPLVPLPETGRMNRRVRFLGGQNKNVDDVLAARIDQSGDILATENIQTPADQRKTFIGKILHRGNKSKLAVEPGLDGVLVGGSYVGKVAGLKRAHVSVNDLRGSKGRRSG